MASIRELRARWKTPEGKITATAVENALRAGASREELNGYLRKLPHADEVAPSPDLRGAELKNLVSIRKADLSGVRFDGALVNWNFGGSALRGCVFDEAEGSNVPLGGCDLSESTFVRAKLPGAIFYASNLRDCDFTEARLRSGMLKEADCRNAKFCGADLRMVWAADTDLRGADLSDADLTGASLGGAKWDESTRFDRAKLTVEGTPSVIREYARNQGASVGSEKGPFQLSLLDATVKALEWQGKTAEVRRITARLRELRPEVERDPKFLWANVLEKELDRKHWSLFQEAVRKAASNIGTLTE